MATILAYGSPALGHLLPVSALLGELAGRGHEVHLRTLAAGVAKRSGLRRVSSDLVRKRLAGLSPGERGGADLYTEEHTARTYAELVREALAGLATDRGAIVDATFHERLQRRRITDAIRPTGARLVFCECRAPDATLRRRGVARSLAPELGSDAT